MVVTWASDKAATSATKAKATAKARMMRTCLVDECVCVSEARLRERTTQQQRTLAFHNRDGVLAEEETRLLIAEAQLAIGDFGFAVAAKALLHVRVAQDRREAKGRKEGTLLRHNNELATG